MTPETADSFTHRRPEYSPSLENSSSLTNISYDIPNKTHVNGIWTLDNETRRNGNENGTLTKTDPLISLQVPATMFAAGVFGNLLAICVLLRSSKEHKQTVFYRLVGALALTDLIGTCAISPVTLVVYANNLKWVGGDALCNYESFMFIFAGYSTIFIIGMMAVDRFVALVHPFFYDSHVTYSRAKYGILSLWVFAAFMGLLPVMGLGENVKQYPGTWCFFSFTSSEIKNQIFSFTYATIGLLIICVTAISNIVVTFTLLKMRRKVLRSMNTGTTKRHDSELQMVILLMGIMIVFSTCWCPFLIRILINQVNQSQVDVKADLHALRLASFNQILDPWIYILLRKELFTRSYYCMRNIVYHRCRSMCKERFVDSTVARRQANDTKDLVPDPRLIPHTDAEDVVLNLIDKPADKVTINDEQSSVLPNNYCGISKNSESRGASWNRALEKSCSDGAARVTSCKMARLNLKHSACLFCLSSQPKFVVLSSRSMKSLSGWKDDMSASRSDYKPDCLHHGMRRQSFHQSLEDAHLRSTE